MDCWHEDRYAIMLEAVKRRPLHSTFQGSLLNGFINSIDFATCLDIGCGTGQVSQFMSNYKEYHGCDLPGIITNVAEKSGFDGFYMGMDMESFNGTICRQYDLVIMSAFIDVLKEPVAMLTKILGNCRGYVIIHRQEITGGDTEISEEPSYGGFTYHSKINSVSFKECIKDFDIIKEASCKYDNWENGGLSILLKRKSDKTI